jgi:hypothetical protein
MHAKDDKKSENVDDLYHTLAKTDEEGDVPTDERPLDEAPLDDA